VIGPEPLRGGVAVAPLDFRTLQRHDLLIGQFAGAETLSSDDGFHCCIHLAPENSMGLLQDASGKPLAINGIWALSLHVKPSQ